MRSRPPVLLQCYQVLQTLKPLFTYSLDVHKFFDAVELARFVSMLNDEFRGSGTDTWKSRQLFGCGCIQIDLCGVRRFRRWRRIDVGLLSRRRNGKAKQSKAQRQNAYCRNPANLHGNLLVHMGRNSNYLVFPISNCCFAFRTKIFNNFFQVCVFKAWSLRTIPRIYG